MGEVLLSGLKEFRGKLKKEIEELEDKIGEEKKESVNYSSLRDRIDYRYEVIEGIDQEIKLQERAIKRAAGGKEKVEV